jgi:hypothetical protein
MNECVSVGTQNALFHQISSTKHCFLSVFCYNEGTICIPVGVLLVTKGTLISE